MVEWGAGFVFWRPKFWVSFDWDSLTRAVWVSRVKKSSPFIDVCEMITVHTCLLLQMFYFSFNWHASLLKTLKFAEGSDVVIFLIYTFSPLFFGMFSLCVNIRSYKTQSLHRRGINSPRENNAEKSSFAVPPDCSNPHWEAGLVQLESRKNRREQPSHI